MQSVTTLRARVSPEAISKVTRIFNGTLDDIFNELLQNARRAGATKIAVSALHLEDACVITVADDGAGIDDPENLVSLGQSDWTDDCRAREDPAGMGFFSLAGRDTVVSSSSASTSFSIMIEGPAWTGEADIEVVPWQGPRGTTISFTFDAVRDGELERVVKSAACYFPWPVTYNGEPLPRADFLERAHVIVEREGYRIGVFQNAYLDNDPTINFHGLTLKHGLAHIEEVHRRKWGVKVDIVDAPELVLVLPARKEVYLNAALDRLIELCHEAIFTALRAEPFHRLAHNDWLSARAYLGDFPEAIGELRPWPQVRSQVGCQETPEYVPVGGRAAIYNEADAFEAVTFERAIAFSHGDDGDVPANRILAPRVIDFHAAVPQYEGYGWYDRLACYVRTGEIYRQHDGAETLCEADKSTFRPDTVVLTFADQHGGELSLKTDFAIVDCPDGWNNPDTVQIALTRTSSIDPGTLTDLIVEAAFSPSDDYESDCYATQETRFRHDAVVRAHTILEGEDAATLAGIRTAFGEEIAWRIPHGRTLQLSWSRDKVHLELSLAEPARAE